MAGIQKYIAASDDEKQLLALCANDLKPFPRSELSALLAKPQVRVDAIDRDGMSALMHAAFKGNVEACEMLIARGADVNCNLQTDCYTALMFATVAGHVDVVKVLLAAGARTSAVNNFGKTAAELGAFLGQHTCAQVIKNFFSLSDLEVYTVPQGVDQKPIISPSLVPLLHSLVIFVEIHPVWIIQKLRTSHNLLLSDWHAVTRVLSLVSEKLLREGQEVLSLKMHYLAYVIRRCQDNTGGPEGVLKILLTVEADGQENGMEKFMVECLMDYPHASSPLVSQMIASLRKGREGLGVPSALSLFCRAISGGRSAEEDVAVCNTCGVSSSTAKRCTGCKKVWYCDVECQKLSWSLGNHRHLCKKWSAATSKKQPAGDDVTSTSAKR
ncbi:hypothetical protein EMCRGX_G030616 [Ephydatia muelleri]